TLILSAARRRWRGKIASEGPSPLGGAWARAFHMRFDKTAAGRRRSQAPRFGRGALIFPGLESSARNRREYARFGPAVLTRPVPSRRRRPPRALSPRPTEYAGSPRCRPFGASHSDGASAP